MFKAKEGDKIRLLKAEGIGNTVYYKGDILIALVDGFNCHIRASKIGREEYEAGIYILLNEAEYELFEEKAAYIPQLPTIEITYNIGDYVIAGKNNINKREYENKKGYIIDKCSSEYKYKIEFDNSTAKLWCNVVDYAIVDRVSKYNIGDVVIMINGGRQCVSHYLAASIESDNHYEKRKITEVIWQNTIIWYKLENYGNWVTEEGLELVDKTPPKKVYKDDKGRVLKEFEVGKWYANPKLKDWKGNDYFYVKIESVTISAAYEAKYYYNSFVFSHKADKYWNIVEERYTQSNSDYDGFMVLVEPPVGTPKEKPIEVITCLPEEGAYITQKDDPFIDVIWDYLKKKFPGVSDTKNNGIAWNSGSYWFVRAITNKKEYTKEQLLNYKPPVRVVEEPPKKLEKHVCKVKPGDWVQIITSLESLRGNNTGYPVGTIKKVIRILEFSSTFPNNYWVQLEGKGGGIIEDLLDIVPAPYNNCASVQPKEEEFLENQINTKITPIYSVKGELQLETKSMYF